MKIVAIIQARMGSTRLPGKILKEINNKPMLYYQLERLKESIYIDELVIATTTEKTDDLIVDFCEQNDIAYFRGSERDVLNRYYETAKFYKADIIVRITSDCPIIDVRVVDEIIQLFVEKKSFDYMSNTIERSYPRGLDTEVFSMEALIVANKEARLERDREHVTPYFYTNPSKFNIMSIKNPVDYSKYRWTVDTVEDFMLIKLIIEKLYKKNPHFTLQETIVVMEQNPEWFKINEQIIQKKL